MAWLSCPIIWGIFSNRSLCWMGRTSRELSTEMVPIKWHLHFRVYGWGEVSLGNLTSLPTAPSYLSCPIHPQNETRGLSSEVITTSTQVLRITVCILDFGFLWFYPRIMAPDWFPSSRSWSTLLFSVLMNFFSIKHLYRYFNGILGGKRIKHVSWPFILNQKPIMYTLVMQVL